MSDSVDASTLSREELAEYIKQLQNLKRDKAEEERINKTPAKRGRGVMEHTKRVLLDDPNISNDDLYKKVSELVGPPLPSRLVMTTTRSDFMATLRILEEAGRLLPKEAEVIDYDRDSKAKVKAKGDSHDKEEKEEHKATGD